MVCLLLFKSTFGQNLIQNGDFEIFDSIDCGGGGFDNYYYTVAPHVVKSWYGYQSPDYFNSFCNPGGFSVPYSYFGNNYSKSGSAYIGLVPYAKGGYDKEYIYQHLFQPLDAGKVYCLSFYVNRADRFTYAIKSIGALFTNNLLSTTNIYEINAIPQVVHSGGFISDTTQWTQIQGCFTANGGEQYITIGNFTTNYNTDTLNTNSTNLIPGREGVSYYYIDDVSLIDQSTVGVSELNNGGSIGVYPNPTNDILNFTNIKTEEKINIRIIDIIGKDVLVTEYKSQLDISFLESGIYLLNLYKDEQLIKIQKVIKK